MTRRRAEPWAVGALLLLGACSQRAPVASPTPPAEPAPSTPAAITVSTEAPAAPVDAAQVAGAASPEQAGARELQPDEDAAGEGLDAGSPVDLSEADAAYAASLLHEARDAYEQASLFWREGSEPAAIAALDRAWDRMAKIPERDGSDVLLLREKASLRQAIARRVVEISAATTTAVGDTTGAIPRPMNDEIRYEIASFQGREREFFLEAYRRSGLYRPMILEELRKAGMPEQLSWLPLVESGFKDRALSTARALGLWQFIPSTGYRYGLDRSDAIDERMDPEKSTGAAIGYLTALHGLFGDWLTALASYNCGEHNVLRAIGSDRMSYFDQFWDLYQRLPRETRRYVPRFLATLEIVENPAKYGFELPEPLPPLVWETIEVARPAQLAALDKLLGVEPGTLQRLNPELRRNGTPKSAYPLKVPPGTGATVLASLDSLPKWEPPVQVATEHRVRAGETLGIIAARYRTTVPELMRMNRLKSAHRLSIGQRLQVPDRTGGSSSPRASKAKAEPVGAGNVYVVQSGDTLGSIAEREKIPLERLLAANDLSPRAMILPGQRIKIPS